MTTKHLLRSVSVLLWLGVGSMVADAQTDTTSDFQFRLNTEFRQIYLSGLGVFPTWPRVKLPSNVYRDHRYQRSIPPQLSDNPLLHSACYAMFEAELSLHDRFYIQMKPVFEQRGMSYGILNTRTMATYLRARASYHEDIGFLNDTLSIAVTVGDLPLKKLHQGLKIWNIDMQGTSSEMKYRNLSYRMHHLGDLLYWVGIGIGDLRTHSLRWESNSTKNWSLGAGPILTNNMMVGSYISSTAVGSISVYEPGFELFLQYKSTRAFFEASTWLYKHTRSSWSHFGQSQRSAFLAGIETAYKSKKSTLTLSTKYRYYGYLYLRVFYDGNTRYRDQDTIFRFINTVGDYLYPLENYFRPVSQFSVFAQSQKFPFNLNGWEFQGVLDYRISDRFINTLTLETITLWPYIVDNKKTLFTYIYYTNMFSYQPDPKLLISFVITNKMMDLDASYHAHYMTVTPFLGISFWKKM